MKLDRTSAIVARSLYRELHGSGYSPPQIVAVATALIDLVAREIKQARKTRDTSLGRPLILGRRTAVDAEVREFVEQGAFALAATAVHTRYGPEIMALLLAFFGDEKPARDAYTEFVSKLPKAAAGFDHAVPASMEAYRIAVATAHQHEAAARPTLAIARAPDDREEAIAILRARLVPRERLVLSLRIDRELSFDQLAFVLDSTPSQVEEDFHAASKQLARLAAQSGFFDEAAS